MFIMYGHLSNKPSMLIDSTRRAERNVSSGNVEFCIQVYVNDEVLRRLEHVPVIVVHCERAIFKIKGFSLLETSEHGEAVKGKD